MESRRGKMIQVQTSHLGAVSARGQWIQETRKLTAM